MNTERTMKKIIFDILSTDEYSLSGIAEHTKIPEDLLCEIFTGTNVDLTFEASRKIFELHISVRRNLYDDIMKKMFDEYFLPSHEKRKL